MLGTRGVPASHGGFETAVEHIGAELVRRGWRVVVYCQAPRGARMREDRTFRGMELVEIPERIGGAVGTIQFDRESIAHAARHRDICVSFGYNTAFLNARLVARGIPTIFNMDGIEWQRSGWSGPQRAFLRWNERRACRLGDALIADHPEIETHLLPQADAGKLSVITYGAPVVRPAHEHLLEDYGLEAFRFLTLIARPVPENSILEIVRAFSRRPRGVKLAVLGDYAHGVYQHRVREAASDEVTFLGPVYDSERLVALRSHSLAYAHGHTVGGTNPSLVEALGAGNAVIAHDNRFNRWVAGRAGLYFADEDGFEAALGQLLAEPGLVEALSRRARERHALDFEWSTVTDRYEELLTRFVSTAAVETGSVGLDILGSSRAS